MGDHEKQESGGDEVEGHQLEDSAHIEGDDEVEGHSFKDGSDSVNDGLGRAEEGFGSVSDGT